MTSVNNAGNIEPFNVSLVAVNNNFLSFSACAALSPGDILKGFFVHYYQFNIGDYAKHTHYLSMFEHLAYRLLLDRYYLTEKPLDLDVERLARVIGMKGNTAEVHQVLNDFFVLTDAGYSNKRCDEEILEYHRKSGRARANGKKGGRPKKSDSEPRITQPVNLGSELVMVGLAKLTDSQANHKPLTINHKRLTNKSIDQENLDRMFELFWLSGIRKTGKKQARSVFIKIISAKKQKAEFTDYLINDIKWRLNNDQFGFAEMHPTTYLRNERWLDERRDKQQATNGSGRSSLAERSEQQTRIIQSKLAAGEFDKCAMGQNDPAISAQMDIVRGGENDRGAIDAEFHALVPENGGVER